MLTQREIKLVLSFPEQIRSRYTHYFVTESTGRAHLLLNASFVFALIKYI